MAKWVLTETRMHRLLLENRRARRRIVARQQQRFHHPSAPRYEMPAMDSRVCALGDENACIKIDADAVKRSRNSSAN